VDERDWLAERVEEHRGRLRSVAYRMLRSLSEGDDAVDPEHEPLRADS
jgi:RNA polymerase sigma-70 factor (ECF subfamily)